MKREEIQAWYADLVRHSRLMPARHTKVGNTFYNDEAVCVWATQAETALAAVFPKGHPTRQAWARVLDSSVGYKISMVFPGLRGVFEGAAVLVRDNRLGSLIYAIRIESESELLDQARALVDNGYRAAGAIIAGGALETHLRHYVDKHGIPIAGDGTISKYNSAVGQARKANPNMYSANDAKLVEAWGGYRNEAAHKPGEFNRSKEDVKRMIEGVREFIGRTE